MTDDDLKYTLSANSSIELGGGYELAVDQIDVKGKKANLVLKHDGNELNSSIVTTGDGMSGDWIFKTDVLNDKNVQVLRVHVKDVFQGTKDSIVEIEGLWLADYLNAFEVKSDEDYGKWEAYDVNSQRLSYVAKDISLSSGAVIDLGQNWSLKVQDGFEIPPAERDEDYEFNNRFYLFEEYTEPGKYELRSAVSFANRPVDRLGILNFYSFFNFPGFFYDLDKHLFTEFLLAIPDGTKFTDDLSSFAYVTTYVHTDYEYLPNDGLGEDQTLLNSWDSGYDVMGYFGELYVPFNIVDISGFHEHDATKLEKFAPLVIDSDDKHTLNKGGFIELGKGYTLHILDIDVEGNQAHLELQKDGTILNSSIVTTSSEPGGSNWIFKDKVLGTSDVQILRVHVENVFRGEKDDLVSIDGLWLTDYQNAVSIDQGDEVGLLEYHGVYGPDEIYIGPSSEQWLVFGLKNNLSLSDGMDLQIAENLNIRAESGTNGIPPSGPVSKMSLPSYYISDLRYYFYSIAEIEELGSGSGNNDNGSNNTSNGSNNTSSSDNDNTKGVEKEEGQPVGSSFNVLAALALAFFIALLILIIAYLYMRYRARKKAAEMGNPNMKS
ncbi:hypothetical protein MmiAt1_02880 [Methanimicrococcus sp. At1]|uniref:S-layer family duplication domain-containing protein n=1 Tax=Methanimicrococcus hacksteinii TaxID=3028293 RepID=A0ABU3VMW9_9EURY|nr:hypothetical protein [Methanimicrococcus sp. At1]